MKKYEKPEVKDEEVVLEDIIAVSNKGETVDGDSKSILDLDWEDA